MFLLLRVSKPGGSFWNQILKGPVTWKFQVRPVNTYLAKVPVFRSQGPSISVFRHVSVHFAVDFKGIANERSKGRAEAKEKGSWPYYEGNKKASIFFHDFFTNAKLHLSSPVSTPAGRSAQTQTLKGLLVPKPGFAIHKWPPT